MATDRIINQTQGDEIIAGLLAIKNAITNQPVPTTVEDVVAPVFDDGVSYTVGEFVMHEGLLYKCTTAHHGAWNGSDFTLTTMGDQVSALNNDLSPEVLNLSTWTMQSGAVVTLTKIGKIAYLSIRGSFDRNYVANTTYEISNLNSAYFPKGLSSLPTLTNHNEGILIFFDNNKLKLTPLTNIASTEYNYIFVTYMTD